MLLVIDGPERAGKSTLVAALQQQIQVNGLSTRTRHWGKLDDVKWAADWVYRNALAEDSAYGGLVIWDRSWASEAVYGQLLERNRRLAEDPWLGEWLYGRGVALKYILCGPTPETLDLARTDDDLPVDPAAEQQAFYDYGTRYGWRVIPPTHERLRVDFLVSMVRGHVDQFLKEDGRDPREWCGPLEAAAVIVGERGSPSDNLVGGLLPFTSVYTTRLGRALGDAALRVGWTNAWDDQRDIFRRARLVVACGATAAEWAEEVKSIGQWGTVVHRVTHPAALYRWGRYRGDIERTEQEVRDLVGSYVTGVAHAKAG